MSDLHSLHDYAFAKEMLAAIPVTCAALQKAQDILFPHRGFNGVCDAMISIESAILQLETRLPYFEAVVKTKGEV